MLQAPVLRVAKKHVHFRHARLEDAEALLALRASALRSLSETYSPEQIAVWRETTGLRELSNAIGQEDELLICAIAGYEADGSPVGFVHVEFGTSVYLLALYVDPGEQANGIGTGLLCAAHAICRERGVARIQVAASLNAAQFYARRGYVRIGIADWHPTGKGIRLAIPAVKMAYRL